MIDISAWAGKELAFTASGSINLGGSNGASPDGRDWVLRPAGLSQVYGLTAMRDFRHGALVGVFLTDDPPASGLLPYMSSSGITTPTPPLQHIFVIGSSSQVVIPAGATRPFFGVAEQQGCIIDNGGSFDLTVEAVPHTLFPADPLAAARFYTGDPNNPKDGFRDHKQRLGTEECRAWTKPVLRTFQVQMVAMTLLRLMRFCLDAG